MTFRRLLGPTIFFSCNFVFILYQTVLMGQPRLGDDAATYLFKGTALAVLYDQDTPMLKVLSNYFELAKGTNDEATQFYAARVTMRHLGSLTPGFDWLPLLTSRTSLPLKWQWFLIEVLILVILTLGLHSLFSQMIGGLRLDVLFWVAAVTMFPHQGLHYFIPGVLSFALALILYSRLIGVISRPSNWRSMQILILATLCIAIHPIGKVYVLIGLALYLLAGARKGKIHPIVPAACVVAIAVQSMVGRIPRLIIPVEGFAGRIANLSDFLDNCVGSMKMIWEFGLQNPVAPVLGMIGAIGALTRRDRNVPFYLILIASVFIASQMFYLPGYPGELWSRMIIPVSLAVFGYALRSTDRRAVIAVVAILALWSARNKARYALMNVNMRNELVDDVALSKELDSQSRQKPVVLCETDLTLPYLAIHSRLRQPVLFAKHLLDRQMGQFSTAEFLEVLPLTESFNFNSRFGWHPLSIRKMGFDLEQVSEFEIVSLTPGLRTVFINIDHTSHKLDFSGKINIKKQARDGWISSITTSETPNLLWGWNQGLEIRFVVSGESNVRRLPLEVSFIEKSWGCDIPTANISVVSDRSGFILAKSLIGNK